MTDEETPKAPPETSEPSNGEAGGEVEELNADELIAEEVVGETVEVDELELVEETAPPPPPVAAVAAATPPSPKAPPKAPPRAPTPAPAPAPQKPTPRVDSVAIARDKVRALRLDPLRAARQELYRDELASLASGGVLRGERIALLNYELGELAESRARDEAQAVNAYGKALSANAAFLPNRWAIRWVFLRRKLWPNLIKLIDAELRYARDDHERSELLFEKGVVLVDEIGDAAAAKDALAEAIARDAKNVRAWMALERIAIASGDADERRRAIDGIAEASTDATKKAALWLEAAEREAASGGEGVDRGLALVARAVEQTGGASVRALDVWARIARRAERWLQWLSALDKLAELEGARGATERVLAIRVEQGAIAERAGMTDEALHYFRIATDAAPEDPVVWELSRRAARASVGTRADFYADGRPADLTGAARVLERVALLREGGRAAEADALLDEHSALLRGDLVGLVTLSIRAEAAQKWNEYVELCGLEAELAKRGAPADGIVADTAWATDALVRAGGACLDSLGDSARAESALSEAIALSPHSVEAMRGLGRVYASSGRIAELAALFDRWVAAMPNATQPQLDKVLAALVAARSQLGEHALAAAAQRRRVALEGVQVADWTHLAVLDRRAGDWAALAEDLERIAQLEQGGARTEARLARAIVLSARLGRDDDACEEYRKILADDPSDARAKPSLAMLLDRRARKGRASSTEGQDRRAWDELVAALEQELERGVTADRAREISIELADLHERRRGDIASAVRVWRALLDQDPGSRVALSSLARIYREINDADKLREVLTAAAAQTQGRARAALLLEAAELAETNGRDLRAAKESVLAAKDAMASTHTALAELALAQRSAAPVAELSEALEDLLAVVPAQGATGAARAALLSERAAWLLGAGSLDLAERLLSEGESIDDGVIGAWTRLRVRAASTNAEGLAEAYGKIAERVTEPGLRRELSERSTWLSVLARRQKPDLGPDRFALVEEHAAAGRSKEALALVEAMVRESPRDIVALVLDERLRASLGDAHGAAVAGYRLAEAIGDGERAAQRFLAAADAFEALGRHQDAFAALRGALGRMPRDGTVYRRARGLLIDKLQPEQRRAALVELVDHRLSVCDEEEERNELLVQRAEELAAAEDYDAASADLKAVIRSNGNHARAVRALAGIFVRSARGRAEASRLLEHFLGIAQSEEEQRRALVEHAAALAAVGGDADAAIVLLERANGIAERREELVSLAELLERRKRWQQAIEVLTRLAALTDASTPRADLYVRIAKAWHTGLGQSDRAVEATLEALAAEPQHVDAFALLVALAQAGRADRDELERRLDRALTLTRSEIAHAPDRVESYRLLAKLFEWRQETEGQSFALQIVALLSGGASLQASPLDTMRALDDATWQRFLPERARLIELDVWRQAQTAAGALYGADLDALGLGRANRLPMKNLASAWRPAVTLIQAFVGHEVEIYANNNRPNLCVSAGDALVVGSAFAEELLPHARVKLAYATFLHRERLESLVHIEAEELCYFFAGAFAEAELQRPARLVDAGLDEVKVEDRKKSIHKPMSRKERKAIEALGARISEVGDLGQWRRAVFTGAERAALVATGDLATVLTVLGRKVSEATELIEFAVSEECLRLRKELKGAS